MTRVESMNTADTADGASFAESEESALMRGILENPDDDARRLIFADWLTDHGDEVRGEFIRVQVSLARDPKRAECPCIACNDPSGRQTVCLVQRRELELHPGHDGFPEPAAWKYLPDGSNESDRGLCLNYRQPFSDWSLGVWFRRGFVAEIAAPTALLFGGECSRCEGEGTVPEEFECGGMEVVEYVACPDCKGAGRTPGRAAEIFRACPTIERVVLTDREPGVAANDPNRFAWFREGGVQAQFDLGSTLPDILMDFIADDGPFRSAWYAGREAALDALSTACCLFGRRGA